jgi:dienelactone hydrolase
MSPQHPREEAKLRRQKAQFRRRSLDLVRVVAKAKRWRHQDDLVFSMGFSWWFHGDVIGLGFNGAKNLFKYS